MRSLFPTCLFNASLDLPQVGLARGSLLVPVCPGIGDLNAACPLPWFESLDPGLASDPASPSGLAPPDHCVPPICDRKAHLPKQPDVRCSPPSRYAAGGSSLRIRYCFGGWLFLKPLGTDSILSLADPKVNRVLRS